MEKLTTFYVDVEKGVMLVNGQEVKNVTAFSMSFKDGEYGLRITHDDTYSSKTTGSRFFVDMLPDETFSEGVSTCVGSMNFTYQELALLNQMIGIALMSGKIEFNETSNSVHQKIANELYRLNKSDLKQMGK